jgi:putative thioredoxin
LSPILEKLTSEFGGKIVLAKIDSDANPRLSQAFQVQSIPSVFLVINGQVQPLFQGALPEAQVRTVFEKILEVAQQMGLTGEVETETTVPAESQPVEPQIDARFAPAYDALERQDWASARAAFKELLDKNPTDEEAKAGLVQVALLERTLGKDFGAILAAPMANLEDRLLRADVLLLSGELEQSFDLLIAEMAGADSETKATLRDRLIDYFLLVGDCEEVRIGRRKMTNALY